MMADLSMDCDLIPVCLLKVRALDSSVSPIDEKTIRGEKLTSTSFECSPAAVLSLLGSIILGMSIWMLYLLHIYSGLHLPYLIFWNDDWYYES